MALAAKKKVHHSKDQKLDILQEWAESGYSRDFDEKCGVSLTTLYLWRRSYNAWGEEAISRPPPKPMPDLKQIRITHLHPDSFNEFKDMLRKKSVRGLSVKAALEIMISLADKSIVSIPPKISGETVFFACNVSKESLEKVEKLRVKLGLNKLSSTRMVEYLMHRAYAFDFVLGKNE